MWLKFFKLLLECVLRVIELKFFQTEAVLESLSSPKSFFVSFYSSETFRTLEVFVENKLRELVSDLSLTDPAVFRRYFFIL